MKNRIAEIWKKQFGYTVLKKDIQIPKAQTKFIAFKLGYTAYLIVNDRIVCAGAYIFNK